MLFLGVPWLMACAEMHRRVVVARDLFDRMPERNMVSLSAMIDGYMGKCFNQEVFFLLNYSVNLLIYFQCLITLCNYSVDLSIYYSTHATLHSNFKAITCSAVSTFKSSPVY